MAHDAALATCGRGTKVRAAVLRMGPRGRALRVAYSPCPLVARKYKANWPHFDDGEQQFLVLFSFLVISHVEKGQTEAPWDG